MSWERCEVDGCVGARAPELGACLAHLDDSAREGQLRRFGRGRPLDARGVQISSRLWQQIIDAAPEGPEGEKQLSAAQFDQATIHAPVSLEQAVFRRNASFQGVQFCEPVTLHNVVVNGQAQFSGAVFRQGLSVTGGRIEGAAWFAGAQFDGPASFAGNRFWGPAWFTEAAFAGPAAFDQAAFEKNVAFTRASFSGPVSFSGTDFGDDVEFGEATFASTPSFESAAFKGAKGLPSEAKTRSSRWWGPPLASWWQRVKASSIDAGIGIAIAGVLVAAALGLNSLNHVALANVVLGAGPVIALLWLWRNLVIQGRSGQSLGKRVVGLRLLNERDRRPVGGWRSVARGALHLVDTLPLLLGWFRPLWNRKGQTLADSLTGTVVVVVGKNFARANTSGPVKPASTRMTAR